MPTFSEEYTSIARPRRLAIFFAVIGVENAAAILKSFDDEAAETVVREMVEIDLVEESLQQQVLEEFSGLLLESVTSVRGGQDVALQIVENARESGRARSMASKLGLMNQSKTTGGFGELGARQILGLLKAEQPQTMAYVLSAIDAVKAADVLNRMDEAVRSEVVVLMSQLGSTPADVLQKVVRNLMPRNGVSEAAPVLNLGGVPHLAGILKEMEGVSSKLLLSAIEAADSVVGAAISKEMFSFHDLVSMSESAMQRLLREVDSVTMVLAMKSASVELQNKIYSCLSKRGAEALREEFELQGPVRLKEVEVAQDAVLQIVLTLEESGEISLGEGGDEYV